MHNLVKTGIQTELNLMGHNEVRAIMNEWLDLNSSQQHVSIINLLGPPLVLKFFPLL